MVAPYLVVNPIVVIVDTRDRLRQDEIDNLAGSGRGSDPTQERVFEKGVRRKHLVGCSFSLHPSLQDSQVVP